MISVSLLKTNFSTPCCDLDPEAGEQFMQPGPNSGIGEQYNRGPPGPMGNMQMGQRQQYPYGYDRR